MADTIDEQLAYDEQQTPFDANDPEVIEQAQKDAALAKSKKLRVVEAIMSTEDGRAWMHDLSSDCHTFTDNQMHATAERNGRFEGQRSIGLRLFQEIMEASPEMWWRMVTEARDRLKQ